MDRSRHGNRVNKTVWLQDWLLEPVEGHRPAKHKVVRASGGDDGDL